MGRKIEFVHYLHDMGSVNENVKNFEHSFGRNSASTSNLENVEYDEAVQAVDAFYENRPFYEIGLKVSLDIDTGKYEIIGIV